jgi:hypothetical protein
MHRRIIVGFLWLLLTVAQAVQAAERGVLFEVSGKGKSMLLFGTMHIGAPDFYPLEPRLAAALQKAPVLVLEVNPLGSQARQAAVLQTHATLPAGVLLDQQLAPPLRERLDKVLQNAGMSMSMVARYKPWMLAVLLPMVELMKSGFRPELSVDLHLAQAAQARGVPILELESIELQMKLFDSLTPSQQMEVLEETVALAETGRLQAESAELTQAWRHADRRLFDSIVARMEKDETTGGRFVRQVILEQRNVPMADKLAKLFAEQDQVVVGVGALHLLGKGSIPELLRARGLAVRRIY